MSLEWYSSGLSSSDESRNRLMRLLLRATVETEHLEVFGELFSVFIVILQPISVLCIHPDFST